MNAKIIKFIARDENLHLGSTQLLLKTLKKDDPVFAEIAKETEEECIKMFTDAVDQEKAWCITRIFSLTFWLGENGDPTLKRPTCWQPFASTQHSWR